MLLQPTGPAGRGVVLLRGLDLVLGLGVASSGWVPDRLVGVTAGGEKARPGRGAGGGALGLGGARVRVTSKDRGREGDRPRERERVKGIGR